MRLVLASASPRRRELLRRAGILFRVRPASVDESVRPDESPRRHVLRLARERRRRRASPANTSWVLIQS